MRKPPYSWIVEFLRLPFCPDFPCLLCVLYPTCEKMAFSCHIRLFHEGEPIWVAFQMMETPCTKPVHRNLWAALWVICPWCIRGLSGKKSRVAFQSQHTLGLVFIPWVEYTLQMRKLPYSCFVEFVSLPFCPDGPRLICPAHPCLWIEGISMPNQASPQRRTHLECFSCEGISLHLFRAQSALGSKRAPINSLWEKPIWEKAMDDFPSKPAYGLMFVLWVQYTMQGGSFNIPDLWTLWDCHSALIALGHYMLFFPLVNRRHLHGKSDFSAKANKFGVPFKQWKLPASNHLTESTGQHISSFANCIGEA